MSDKTFDQLMEEAAKSLLEKITQTGDKAMEDVDKINAFKVCTAYMAQRNKEQPETDEDDDDNPALMTSLQQIVRAHNGAETPSIRSRRGSS